LLLALGRNRRIAILLISCMSLFIVGLDITAVNVALPSIAGWWRHERSP
jgi:hypothetical protein